MSTDSDALDPRLQIQQNLRGDRNQVIGQAIDSTIVNFAGEGQVINLTIHERIPEQSAPPSVTEVKPLTQQEYRQRQVLLNKVRAYWIEGVLEKSLHTEVLIELGLQERLDLVQRPFQEVAEFPEVSRQVLAEGTSATTVFEQMGAGQTLLILGEPGSGKTITLLKLAEDLIARTEKDLSQPIPVVFNLSSWAKKPQAIEQWLIQELLEKYQVSKALGKQWVETESLILLLDGLDEVKVEQRNGCVQTLNQFMQTHGTTEVIICCRIQDYQALNERLVLRTAICIQPLTKAQVNQYLAQAGAQLSTLLNVLHQDEELQDLATSPLLLSIMSLAYQNSTSEDIRQGGTQADYRKRLFDQYIKRMFERRGTTQLYPRQQSERWLIWLAQRMIAAAQTVFLIEKVQPSWLKTRSERSFYVINSILLGGLIGKLIVTLVSILASLILFKVGEYLIPELYSESSFSINSYFTPSEFLIWFIAHDGLVETLIVVLFIGISRGEIKTLETFNWSWGKAKKYFLNLLNGFSWLFPGLAGGFIGWNRTPVLGLFLGLIILVVVGLTHWDIKKSQESNWSWKLFRLELGSVIPVLLGGVFFGGTNGGVGAILGSLLGVVLGLISSGLTYSEPVVKDYPNQGIWKSGKNALVIAILVFVFSFAIYELFSAAFYPFSSAHQNQNIEIFLFYQAFNALRLVTIAALVAGLINGGITCIQHITLRLMFHRLNCSPWNYACFLDYAVDRLFLQKVGGGYIFVHRMLLEHFAAMPLEQEKR